MIASAHLAAAAALGAASPPTDAMNVGLPLAPEGALMVMEGGPQEEKPHGYGSSVAELDARMLPRTFLREIAGDDGDTPRDGLVLVWSASVPAGDDVIVEIVSIPDADVLWRRTHDRPADSCTVAPWWTDNDAGYLLIDAEADEVEAVSFVAGPLASTRLKGQFLASLGPTPHGRGLLVSRADSTAVLTFDGERWIEREVDGGKSGCLPVTTEAPGGAWLATFDSAETDVVSFRLSPPPPEAADIRPRACSFDARRWERAALVHGRGALILGPDTLHLCVWDVGENGGCGEVSIRSWRSDSASWGEPNLRFVTLDHRGRDRWDARVTAIRSACVPWFRITPGGLGARFFGAAVTPADGRPGFFLSFADEDSSWMTFVAVDGDRPHVAWRRYAFLSNIGETIADDDPDGRITLGVAPTCASGYSDHSGVFVIDAETGEWVERMQRKDVTVRVTTAKPAILHEGDLRHVALLEVVPGDHVTFATSARCGVGGGRLEVHRVSLGGNGVVRVGAPLVSVDVPFNPLESTEPLQGFSWSWLSEPPWSVLRFGGDLRFLACDLESGLLQVVDADEPEGSVVVTDVERLLDARVLDSVTQCLVVSEDRVDLIEIDDERQVQRRQTVARFDGPYVNACFPTGVPTGRVTAEAFVVSWSERALDLQRVDLKTWQVQRASVTLPRSRPEVLRIAAWLDGERCRIAVGQPADGQTTTSTRGSGRVTILAFDHAKVRVLHEHYARGQTLEEVRPEDGSGGWGADFGASLTFVADRDGDEIPDVVVSAPGWIAGYETTVISTARGVRLATFHSRDWAVFGGCVSTDPTGRYLLVTGATPGYPEMLYYGSRVELLDMEKSGERLMRALSAPAVR